MVRIVLADDHTVLRAGLKSLLERQRDFEVVGEAGDGRELLRVVDEQRPDVVISDISMPKLNGVEGTSQIVAKHPKTHVIVLSMHTDEAYVLRALKAGARGYLVKESAEADLMMAIRTVHAGKAFFSPSVSALLVEDYVRQMRDRGVEDSYELLSSREREVLQLVAEGQSNKDIAQQLGLSVYTIETHRGNLLQKLNLHSVPELILYAVRKGVIC
ncbi:response regulator containing a CheY-like receiver domain and an HTH DNA-binding domain [Terriglobus roseus DSM 18391]|uniref:Response regulator containing a CheY-like receiver domain and an HTH DNA-binding domain n=1 Tax=Terriglobus roseus (strain DSM 18391 / NRRL B-41598 / KBS 63) TaxID=926566 RepID=I3ZJF5_TERRK|nr:response regulator transcription factor [Terriglobus roseus]AFL89373.1 response regulator containing a CheY-like receiver domain and an HTH DNA-binding domain [Terriglobus roseus DSM 18391]